MTIFVIVNPSAGGGRGRKMWPAIARRLRDRVGPFEHAETAALGDGTRLAREAMLGGATTIIAVGGDGTTNEAINGLVGREGKIASDISVGIVPVGTGSDLSRSIWAAATLDGSIDRIALGKTRLLDVGRVTYVDDVGNPSSRYFLNISSFGVSGPIDRAVNGLPKRSLMPRNALFLAATVRALIGYRFQKVRMRIDDGPGEESTIAVVAVANGRFFGGGMMIAPDAEPDDGLFDIVTLRGASKSVLLRDLQKVFGGRHRNHPAVTIQRGRRLTVEGADEPGAGPVLLDIDGESPGRLPATFEIVPAALSLLY